LIAKEPERPVPTAETKALYPAVYPSTPLFTPLLAPLPTMTDKQGAVPSSMPVSEFHYTTTTD